MGDEIGESKGRRSFSPVVPEKTIREEANLDYELEIESIVKEYPDPKEREIVYKRFIKSEMTERRIVTKKYERARDAWRDSTNREVILENKLVKYESILFVRMKIDTGEKDLAMYFNDSEYISKMRQLYDDADQKELLIDNIHYRKMQYTYTKCCESYI